ncbi:MAG: hypothetical protein WA906_03785, partial [Pacificimonas sp.]
MDVPRPHPPLSLVSNDNHVPGRHESAVPNGQPAPPVLPGPPQLAEAFADGGDVAAAGFVLAQIPRGTGELLWVQDRMSGLETGRPYGQAFARYGADADKLVLACARHAADVLWTLEEGLSCRALTAIVGEIWGDPKALDFTATKRLAMRAERQGVPVFLIRFNAHPNLSAARRRWRVTSLPSLPDPHDEKAPGAPRWRAELFRTRGDRPGVWEAHYDGSAHRLHLAAPLRSSP